MVCMNMTLPGWKNKLYLGDNELEVLKVVHHGSKYSSSPKFKYTSPVIAVYTWPVALYTGTGNTIA